MRLGKRFKYFRPMVASQSGSSSSAPVVSSISPDVGDTAGGVPVTITGTGFTGATSAAIGGVNITSFVVVNDTTITGVSGAHAKGVVNVTVTNAGTGILTNGYEYWNPSSLASCVLWLRADLGITVDGSNNVTQWADQSGTGDANRNFTPAGTDRVPWNSTDAAYNNRATIGSFRDSSSAGDNRLRSGVWSASYSTLTLGIVGHDPGATNHYYSIENNTTDYCAIYGTAGATHNFLSGDGFSNTLSGGTAGSSTAKCFHQVEVNGASSKLFMNATATAEATGTTNATSIGNAAFSIGAYVSTSGTYGVHKIAEVFVFNAVISADDKTKLRKYLNGRYDKAMTG